MQIFLILSSFILLTFGHLAAQPELKWTKYYDGGSYDVVRKITRDIEGNVIVTGTSVASQSTFTNYQTLTIKYDSLGNQKWVSKKDDPMANDDPNALFTDDSGNIYVSGITSDKFFLMKYDPEGNEIWYKLFGNSFTIAFGSGFNLQKNHIYFDKINSTIYCAALADSNGKTQSYVVKFDINGYLIWQHTFTSISQIYDEPVSLLGYKENLYLYGYTVVNDTNSNFYLQKIDTTGTPIWFKEYDAGFNHKDVAVKAVLVSSKSILITGTSQIPDYDEDSQIIKFDSSGEIVWKKLINGYANIYDFPNDILNEKQESFYVSGSLRNYSSDSSSTHANFFIAKYNSYGNLVWINDSLNYTPLEIKKDDMNNIYVLGKIYDNIITEKYDSDGTREWFLETNINTGGFSGNLSIHYEDDFLLASTTQNNYIVRKYSSDLSGDVTSVKKNNNINKNFNLSQNYPNPFNPSTTISYQIPKAGLVILKVYDILGREVTTLVNKEQTVGNYQVEFNASSVNGGLPSGVYMYRLQTGSFSSTKKFILLK